MKDAIYKFIGMDAETRKQTIIAFITAVVDFLSAFHIIEFTDEQVQAVYKLVLVVVTAFVWAYYSHYKNNNFTEEGCIGTGVTRQLKREKEKDYAGEIFYEDATEDPEVVAENEEYIVEEYGTEDNEEDIEEVKEDE
jgi:hypothetical protein